MMENAPAQQEHTPGILVSGFGWETPDPRRVVPTFARQQYRIHCVLDGVGYLKTGDTSFRLSAGTGFIIFPGTVPNYHPDQEQPWEYFWVKLAGDALESYVEQADLSRQAPCFRLAGKPGEIRGMLYDICHAVMIAAESPPELARCFQTLFERISPFQTVGKNKSQYFDECLSFIHEHYRENISVMDIAEHIAIDRTYLYKLFKSNLGISPQTYLIDYRISQACRLLRSTEMSISAVAYEAGFREFSDFSRQFRKRQKITPSQFRILGSYANISDEPK